MSRALLGLMGELLCSVLGSAAPPSRVPPLYHATARSVPAARLVHCVQQCFFDRIRLLSSYLPFLIQTFEHIHQPMGMPRAVQKGTQLLIRHGVESHPT